MTEEKKRPSMADVILRDFSEQQKKLQAEWESRCNVAEFRRLLRRGAVATMQSAESASEQQEDATEAAGDNEPEVEEVERTWPVARCVTCGAEYWHNDQVFDASIPESPMPLWHRVQGELRHACRAYAGGLSATEPTPDIWRD